MGASRSRPSDGKSSGDAAAGAMTTVKSPAGGAGSAGGRRPAPPVPSGQKPFVVHDHYTVPEALRAAWRTDRRAQNASLGPRTFARLPDVVLLQLVACLLPRDAVLVSVLSRGFHTIVSSPECDRRFWRPAFWVRGYVQTDPDWFPARGRGGGDHEAVWATDLPPFLNAAAHPDFAKLSAEARARAARAGPPKPRPSGGSGVGGFFGRFFGGGGGGGGGSSGGRAEPDPDVAEHQRRAGRDPVTGQFSLALAQAAYRPTCCWKLAVCQRAAQPEERVRQLCDRYDRAFRAHARLTEDARALRWRHVAAERARKTDDQEKPLKLGVGCALVMALVLARAAPLLWRVVQGVPSGWVEAGFEACCPAAAWDASSLAWALCGVAQVVTVVLCSVVFPWLLFPTSLVGTATVVALVVRWCLLQFPWFDARAGAHEHALAQTRLQQQIRDLEVAATACSGPLARYETFRQAMERWEHRQPAGMVAALGLLERERDAERRAFAAAQARASSGRTAAAAAAGPVGGAALLCDDTTDAEWVSVRKHPPPVPSAPDYKA